jgi:hypothetical protein
MDDPTGFRWRLLGMRCAPRLEHAQRREDQREYGFGECGDSHDGVSGASPMG